jgi:type 1 glutamine amidotransferase
MPKILPKAFATIRWKPVFALILACSLAVFAQRPCSAVEAVLGRSWDTAAAYPPLNIVLVWGERDAGRPLTDHNWPQFATEWETLLAKVPNVTVSRARYFPTSQQWAQADLMVFYLRTHTFRQEAPTDVPSPPAVGSYTWGAGEFATLDTYMQAGKGLVIMHSATYPDVSFENEWVRRAGLAWKQGTTTFREGNLIVRKEAAAAAHPIMIGMPDTMHFLDETYYPMMKTPDSNSSQVTVLASSNETFQDHTAAHPALWTFTPPGTTGKVYGFIMGHLNASFNDPLFRGVLMRGMAWAASTEFSRFRPAVYSGATYSGACSPPVFLRPGAQLPASHVPRVDRNGALFPWRGEEWKSDGRKGP